MHENYAQILPVLEARGVEVNGFDFYRFIFPNNELSGEMSGDYARPNAVYLYTPEDEEQNGRRLRRRIMLHDTWEQDYLDFVESNPMTLCSGLSYRGRTNRAEHAQRMHALIFDLDGVGYNEIMSLFLRFDQPAEQIRTLPRPTFIVASGGGVHLYYVFETPIDLYPNIKVQLKTLKYALTFRIWEYKGTSQQKAIQYQTINQGFRMVGSVNGKYGTPLRAFQVGERVTIEDLNPYVKPAERVDISRPFQPSKVTREQARLSYPEWYERVIIKGQKGRKKWAISEKVNGSDPYALYHWWIRRAGEVKGGHRYFFLMCTAIYACKCDVPKAKLRADMDEVFHELQQIKHENELTRADMDSALEAFAKEYYCFTINDVEKLTDIRIDRNKRNGRRQSLHLRIARANRDILCEERGKKDWREGAGRPKGSGTAQARVAEYRAEHPAASVSEVARALQISRPTVYKWWDAK